MPLNINLNLNLPQTPQGTPPELFSEFNRIYTAIRSLAAFVSTTIEGAINAVTPVIGKSTLVAGSKIVAHPDVTASTVVFATVQQLGTVAVPKAINVVVTAGVGFTITSADNTDTSVVAWMFYPT